LKSIEKGELGVIGESAFHEGVEMQSPPSNNGSYLTQFIEYQQYLKGSFYNEIGLSANYNMKREAIGKGESTLDEDALLPLCDNMLTCRREDLAKVNEMYGTDISVEFSSSWLENRIEALSALRDMTSGISGNGAFGQPTGIPEPVPSNSEVGQPTDNSSAGEVESDLGQESGNKGATDEQPTPMEVAGVTEETEESEESEEAGITESEDNPESKINDLSQDEKLTELLDKATEEQEIVPLVNQEERSEEDDDANSKEGSDDETDTTTN
jgi:hypothetical protein